MRWVRWTSGLLWIGSWFLMFLEVFHWHHMTTTLRFDPTPPPGVPGRGHPGGPLIAAWVCAIAAPLVFLAATACHRWSVRRR
ncbi:MAG: hypothetical protein JWO98_984 [Frankiales bacterium]|nr:hypothetical protein [Frankiales bacterium]